MCLFLTFANASLELAPDSSQPRQAAAFQVLTLLLLHILQPHFLYSNYNFEAQIFMCPSLFQFFQ